MNKEKCIAEKMEQPIVESTGLYSIKIRNNISGIRLKIIANRYGYEVIAKEAVGENGEFLIVYLTDELYNYSRVKPTCDNWYFSRVSQVVNDVQKSNLGNPFCKYTVTMYRNLANPNEKLYIVQDFSNNVYVVKRRENWVNDIDKLEYIIKWEFKVTEKIVLRKGDYES